jgi:6-phosphogluconolactonase
MNPYDVDLPPAPPALPGTVIVRPDADRAIDALGADLLAQADACVRAFGSFHLALSGGSTPMPLYRRLMIDPTYRALPWARTHLWIVDERRVPFEDDRSNYKHIAELIVEHSGIPANQVHPMLATRDDADTHYELQLREALEWRERGQDRLDFVLLGMGADAHTASLFPRSRALRESTQPAPAAQPAPVAPRMVLINSGPEVTPPDRLTMTPPLINAARCVAVLVTGAGKRDALARVAGAGPRPTAQHVLDLPILSIRPKAGDLRWYLDHDACPR